MPSVSRETAIVEDDGPVVERHHDIGDTTIQFVRFNVDYLQFSPAEKLHEVAEHMTRRMRELQPVSG